MRFDRPNAVHTKWYVHEVRLGRGKESANIRKHYVSFELASRVFDDPFAVSLLDRIEGGERRWQIVGMAEIVQLLLVAYTYRDLAGETTVRIISDRRATKKERKVYEEAP